MLSHARVSRPWLRSTAFAATAAIALTVAGLLTPAHAASPVPRKIEPQGQSFVVGLGVPWAVGITWPGNEIPAEWPPFPVRSLRLWDTRTAWSDIERERGTLDFRRLDEFLDVADRNGTKDVVMVLAGTPTWAAQRTLPTDANWIGPGSASPPRDMSDWARFVTAVAERYRGRMTTYEIGNEPNLPMFWNGSPVEYADFVALAARAIKEADPGARVLANIGLIRRPHDLFALATWGVRLARTPNIDGFAVHFYPPPHPTVSDSLLLWGIGRVMTYMAPGRPVWLTEVNIAQGATLPPPQQQQAAARLTREVRKAGFPRAYWYAWTTLGPDNLMQLYAGTPAAASLSQLSTTDASG